MHLNKIAMTMVLGLAAASGAPVLAGQQGDVDIYVYSCGQAAEKFGLDGFKNSERTQGWGGRDPSPEVMKDIERGTISSVRMRITANGLVSVAHKEPHKGQQVVTERYGVMSFKSFAEGIRDDMDWGGMAHLFCKSSGQGRGLFTVYQREFPLFHALQSDTSQFTRFVDDPSALGAYCLFMNSGQAVASDADDFSRALSKAHLRFVPVKQLSPIYGISLLARASLGSYRRYLGDIVNNAAIAKEILGGTNKILAGFRETESNGPYYFCAGDLNYPMSLEDRRRIGMVPRTVKDVADQFFRQVPDENEVRKTTVSRSVFAGSVKAVSGSSVH